MLFVHAVSKKKVYSCISHSSIIYIVVYLLCYTAANTLVYIHHDLFRFCCDGIHQ
jgi:hypothetical protein